MADLSDLIYFNEAQWRALADLLPTLNREVGLFDGIGGGAPIVIYQHANGDEAGKVIVSSESAFAGEFKIADDGEVEYPEGWDS